MELEFVSQCDSCSATARVESGFVGQRCRCPNCGATILLTSARAADDTDSDISITFEVVDSRGEAASVAAKSGNSKNKSSLRSSSTTKERSNRKLGRYQLSKLLGQGGFGEVWLATDTTLGRKLAIKLPRFRKSDHKRQQRFLSESKAAASLRHPNIVPIFDADEVDGQHYIATEYVSGTPLAEVKVPEEDRIRWSVAVVGKLAEALAYAHSQSIVHRDVKPDNVLVDPQGEPQLLDFGLAKRLDDDGSQTIDGTVMGTPAYMSPEQARGETHRIGPASDQYSLGVILFRLITGHVPFEGSQTTVLQQVANARTKSLGRSTANVPKDVVAICDKTRSREIEDRYGSCAELAEDCENFLGGRPVFARPIRRSELCRRWASQNRREAMLAVSCALIAPLMLLISLSGWWNAQLSADAAARSADKVRQETTRLLELEAQLETMVGEAERARDAARKIQLRESQARKDLEKETRLRISETKRANEAIQQANNLLTQVQNEEQQAQGLIALLDEAREELNSEINLDRATISREITNDRITASAHIASQIPDIKFRLAPTKNGPKVFWFGKVVPLQRIAETKTILSAPNIARRIGWPNRLGGEIHFTPAKEFLVSKGVSGETIIGKANPVSLALIAKFRGFAKVTPPEITDSRTKLSFVSCVAHPNGTTYYTTQGTVYEKNRAERRCLLMEYDRQAMEHRFVRYVPKGSLSLFHFDSTGLYQLIDESRLIRYDLDSLDSLNPKLVFQVRGYLNDVDFISPTMAIVRIGGSGHYLSALIDMSTETWSELNRSVMGPAAYHPSGFGLVLHQDGPQKIQIRLEE